MDNIFCSLNINLELKLALSIDFLLNIGFIEVSSNDTFTIKNNEQNTDVGFNST